MQHAAQNIPAGKTKRISQQSDARKIRNKFKNIDFFLPLLNAFLSSLLAFLPPLQIFQSDDSLTVILLLLLFGFGSAMKKLEGPLFLPKRRKAAFYRCMRCVALSLEASGQGKGSVAEKRSVDLSA